MKLKTMTQHFLSVCTLPSASIFQILREDMDGGCHIDFKVSKGLGTGYLS